MTPFEPALIAPAAAPTPPGAARALIEGQMAMLSRLAEIGMEIAEACGRNAKAPPAATSPTARQPFRTTLICTPGTHH